MRVVSGILKPVFYICWKFEVVGPLGVEPSTNGLCVPLRFSPPLSGLWSGLSLVFTTRPYSLYTFPDDLDLARDYHDTLAKGFPDFERFYRRAE